MELNRAIDLMPRPDNNPVNMDLDADLCPEWFNNDEIRDRVLQVYELHVDRYTYREIAQHLDLAVSTVSLDVKRGRDFQRYSYGTNLYAIVAERVAALEALARRCREAIEDLQAGLIKPSTMERILRNEARVDVPDFHMSVDFTWSPHHARSQAMLLEVQLKAETEINRLLGFGQPSTGINVNISNNSGDANTEAAARSGNKTTVKLTDLQDLAKGASN